jgi:hypothetical protein
MIDSQQVHEKSVESRNSFFDISQEKHTSNQKIDNILVHPLQSFELKLINLPILPGKG